MSIGGVDITSLNSQALSLIESYTGGGFKISGEFYQGSILIIEGEVIAWEVKSFADLSVGTLSPLLRSSAELCFLGCGIEMLRPSTELRQAFESASVGLDFMATPAACRSYNIAIGEERRTAAALIAI